MGLDYGIVSVVKYTGFSPCQRAGSDCLGGLKFEVQHAPSEFHYRTLPRVF